MLKSVYLQGGILVGAVSVLVVGCRFFISKRTASHLLSAPIFSLSLFSHSPSVQYFLKPEPTLSPNVASDMALASPALEDKPIPHLPRST